MRDIAESPVLDVDVAVVGAGFAGVTAARELKSRGMTVALLEARDRLGGRSWSRDIGEGKRVDLGCEFNGQPDSISARTGRSMGVGSVKVYDRGYRLIERDGEMMRWKGLLPKVGLPALADFGQAALRIERMRKEVPEQAPWTAPHARRWDHETIESWTRRNVRTAGGRALMTAMIEAGMAAATSDVSVLHVLNYANGTGGFRAMTTVTGGTLENRFEGGSHGLVMRLAEAVAQDTFVNAVVTAIEHYDDSVRVMGQNFQVTARRVVVAIPVPLAGRMRFDPPLPGYRDQLSQRMTMGSAIKYLALYDEPFWRGDGLTGMAVSHTSPLRAVVDSCPPDGTPGVLAGFVTGRAARTLVQRPAAERRAVVLGELARYFGPRAGRPYDLIEQNWIDEPFTRGCYHAYAPPGLYTEYGPALVERIGRIHWAGAESVPLEFGSMSGAIHSGRRVAAEIEACEHSEVLEHLATPT